ncbi:MAG: MFS transporter, partial [Proteobacteria bacterium]|nr:MFS transporter [Pseudomonadota bacterium]
MLLAQDRMAYRYGIRSNFAQFSHQLVQVFLVGLTIGMFRTVVPALAETEFGVAKDSFMMLMAFVTAFGFVKGTLNFVAGRLSERMGRKKVLFIGWLVAVPMPFMILYAPNWNWIVAATVLLGVNQGLTWSMTQTSKLDLTTASQRGLTIGLNEFSGYFGVAVAGIVTGYMATVFGAREGLMLFGITVILLAGLLTLLWVKDTLPWALAEGKQHAAGQMTGPKPRYPANIADTPDTWDVFTLMSWRDTRMASISQAG